MTSLEARVGSGSIIAVNAESVARDMRTLPLVAVLMKILKMIYPCHLPIPQVESP